MNRLQDASDSQGGAAGITLVPPRPNLGPEPLPESTHGLWPALGVALAIVIVIVIVIAAYSGWRSFRRPKRAVKLLEIRKDIVASNGDSSHLAPHDRLLVLADRARALLIARFGDHWRAKTTEEIVEDREFLAAYDPDSAATLLKLLRRADFEKFADQRVTDQGDMIAVLESWEALVRDVFEAGARSTIKGK